MSFNIRYAKVADAKAINKIANWYIEHTVVNFDKEIWDLKKRTRWVETFNHRGSPYKLLVGETDKKVIGFSCNTQFRPKAAYDTTTETTVYIANGVEPLGRGFRLYKALLKRVAKEEFHQALGVITLPNPMSVRLHEKLGFRLVGVFEEIGEKFDQYHDVAIYQKTLN